MDETEHAEVVARFREALSRGLMVLRRVSGEGSILEQMADADERKLGQVKAADLIEFAVRLEEATESVRRVRAEPGSAVYSQLDLG